MALLDAAQKYDRENDERTKAWDKLRSVNEYVRDVKEATSNPKKTKAFILRWGFPPHDPKNKNPSFDFLNTFSDYCPGSSRFKQVIDVQGLDMFSRKDNRLYDPNGILVEKEAVLSEIQVKITISAPTTVIVNELRDKIDSIKEIFGISAQNSGSHDHLDFLVNLLHKTGLKKEEIQERLMPIDIKALDSDDGVKQAFKKKISDRLDKLSAKS